MGMEKQSEFTALDFPVSLTQFPIMRSSTATFHCSTSKFSVDKRVVRLRPFGLRVKLGDKVAFPKVLEEKGDFFPIGVFEIWNRKNEFEISAFEFSGDSEIHYTASFVIHMLI